jgi:RNA-binding protein FUS
MQGVGGRDGGKPSIFGPDDWTCSNCFNVNWARRNKCNECGTGKEGKAVEKREGRGGGHKEIDDEDEREETARRRRENEEREIYDDFGNLKKQFRASAGRGGADRDYDRGRDRERDHPYRRDDRDRDRDRTSGPIQEPRQARRAGSAGPRTTEPVQVAVASTREGDRGEQERLAQDGLARRTNQERIRRPQNRLAG